MYLSPNDSAAQVNLFFKQLDEQLHQAVIVRRDSFVLLGGDSNSDVGTPRYRRLMELRDKYNGHSTVNEPTRGNQSCERRRRKRRFSLRFSFRFDLRSIITKHTFSSFHFVSF